MTIVLSNDDGIDAPGIEALNRIITGDKMIIAPLEHQSGCGHQVTTYRPIKVEKRNDRAYAVDGTPADCMRLAISHLCPDIDYVISGINEGANLGVDVYISGTIAVVREAAMHGIKGIAISQYHRRPDPIDWDITSKLAAIALDKIIHLPLPNRHFWNINLPHLLDINTLPEIVFCAPSDSPLPINYSLKDDGFYYQGNYSQRARFPGTDIDICFNNKIAITQLNV